MRVPLSLACGAYDRTAALARGDIRPEGVDLTFLALTVEETFFRMTRHREFDAVSDPAGLAGGVVGVAEYQLTANVWIRGILAERHGLPGSVSRPNCSRRRPARRT